MSIRERFQTIGIGWVHRGNELTEMNQSEIEKEALM